MEDLFPYIAIIGIVAVIGVALIVILTGCLDYSITDTVLHKEITTDRHGNPYLTVFTSDCKYTCANYGIYDGLSVGCMYNFTCTESRVIIKINKNLSDVGGED